MQQLPAFRAQTVVYMGCNVHMQAEHVGRVVAGRGRAADAVAGGKGEYVLVSLRQLDLFPQIAHVESNTVRGPYRKQLCGITLPPLKGLS